MILWGIFIYLVYKLLTYIWYKLSFKDIKLGSTVLITGGSQGLGKQLALLYASHKCSLIIWDINDSLFPGLQQEIEAEGGIVFCIKCDISSNEQIKQAAKLTLSKFEKIDVLINNAGICNNYLFEDLSEEKLKKLINVNLIGHALVTKQFINNAAKIVVIASIMSKVPAEKASDYTASKFALDGLFTTLRLELKRQKKNVKVSIVYPYHIKTTLFEGFAMNKIKLVNSLEVTEAASAIYKGVCLGIEEIYIPNHLWYSYFLTSMLPSTLRDYFILYIGEGSLDRVKQN